MSKPAILWAHSHVSERENSHYWPDGQYDDRYWEDCTFDAGLELARICHNRTIPSTHFETERLRDASGEDPSGGTGNDDLLRGLRKRYGYSPSAGVGATKLWAALKPGKAAVPQISMGAFAPGHRLRRWQPGFRGAHQVLVVRVNDWDRVWWCDPLAPEGSYDGEYVSKNDLIRAMNALPWTPSYLIDDIIPRPVPAPAPPPTTGPRVRVKPGWWWDYDVTGTVGHYKVRRDQTETLGGFTAAATGTIIGDPPQPKFYWAGKERRLVQLEAPSAYAGRWVDLNDKGSVTLLT